MIDSEVFSQSWHEYDESKPDDDEASPAPPRKPGAIDVIGATGGPCQDDLRMIFKKTLQFLGYHDLLSHR